ncbi:UBX domain-containing protein 7 [Culicoides brevitarsis]|uniref:UBX domain-containing protein 7 n=1 Tax=Culicoides brevitarsis TaxID=469753 RepID=UPI00307C3463
MADVDENVRTLMEVTAMNFDEAKTYLESKSSLQEAIDAFFNDGASVAGPSNDVIQIPDESSSSSLPPIIPELDPSDPDYVRAPIPKKRDILQEDDNFRGRRYNTRQALCPMRNFAREAELQEQMMFAGGASGEGSSSRPRRNRLEDVFRPPTDLIYAGTFQMVKEFAKNENKWLIVNVQDNTEFACVCMNRDIWSNKDLKAIIRKYFVFYQTSIDCVEGNKIRSFYNIVSYPYVGILDPRTGEEQIASRGHFKYTADEYSKELFTFLHNNYTPDYVDSGKTPSKYQQDSQQASSSQAGEVAKDLSKIISLTEEEQLEIAIKKSMEEAAVATVISDDSADEYASDDEDSRPPSPKRTKTDHKPETEPEVDETVTDGPQTRLMIKQPNGTNEVITRGAATTIGALLKLLQRKYKDQIGTHKCRVYCPAVRQELCDIDATFTLEQAKLHPSAVLHISAED